MESENKRVPSPDNANDSNGLEIQGVDGENVVLLLVQGTWDESRDYSKKLRSLSLEPQEYERILKYAVVTCSDWQKLLGTSSYYSQDPKTLKVRLPDDYLALLFSNQDKNYGICPVFYNLVSEYCSDSVSKFKFNILIEKWSEKLLEALRKNKVCVCESVSGEIT